MLCVTSFYRFVPLGDERLGEIRSELKAWMAGHAVLGLVVLANEGINGTVAGEPANIGEFKVFVGGLLGLNDLRFKDSTCEEPPFHRVSVDIRSEIVGMKRPDLVPDSVENSHLSPREWHEILASDQPKVVIDTRNRYETLAGKFKGAVDPGLSHFSEWGKYLDSAEIPEDVPVLIYCTGGIRCEKAILELRRRGRENVYQLRDGILGYLAEYPDGFYEGDCFVFDDRVAVDRNLQPSGRYGICPGCGLTSDAKQTCGWCGADFFLCAECEVSWEGGCSKTCRDRIRRHGNPVKDSVFRRDHS